MTGMEEETLEVIAKNEGRLHYYLIAERLRISSPYAYLICKGLERNGYIEILPFKGICSLTEKGKEVIDRNWFFRLKTLKENIQEERKESKKKILKNVETINY